MISLTSRNYTLLHRPSCERRFSVSLIAQRSTISNSGGNCYHLELKDLFFFSSAASKKQRGPHILLFSRLTEADSHICPHLRSLTEPDGDMKVVSMRWIHTCTIFKDLVPQIGREEFSNINWTKFPDLGQVEVVLKVLMKERHRWNCPSPPPEGVPQGSMLGPPW